MRLFCKTQLLSSIIHYRYREPDINVGDVPEVGGIAEEVHGEIDDGNEEEDEESSEQLHRLRSVTNNDCNEPLYLVSGCCLNSLLADIPVSCRCGKPPQPKTKKVGSAITVNWVWV